MNIYLEEQDFCNTNELLICWDKCTINKEKSQVPKFCVDCLESLKNNYVEILRVCKFPNLECNCKFCKPNI